MPPRKLSTPRRFRPRLSSLHSLCPAEASALDVHALVEALRREVRLLRVSPPVTEPRLLKTAEVAEFLRVDARTVQRLIRAGDIEASSVRVGGRRLYRVSPAALEAYVRGTKKPRSEAGPEGGRVLRIPLKPKRR